VNFKYYYAYVECIFLSHRIMVWFHLAGFSVRVCPQQSAQNSGLTRTL